MDHWRYSKKSIRYRDKFYAKLKCTNPNDNHYLTHLCNFKTYNKKIKNTIRQTKILYYQNLFQQFKNDLKNTRSTINEILNRNKENKCFPSYFMQWHSSREP